LENALRAAYGGDFDEYFDAIIEETKSRSRSKDVLDNGYLVVFTFAEYSGFT